MVRVRMLFILGLVLMGTTAYAQEAATIVGTITDPTGAVVPNAKITITNTDTGMVRATLSNGTGLYSARDLQIGHYEVMVEASGFKTYTKKNLTLNVGETVGIDVPLQVGEAGQTVTVEATALQVQSETNDISQTITGNQIENLATNGRNILQLTALVPGASSQMADFDKPGAQFQNRSIEFNGMRSDDNNWIIDGGEAYDRGGGGILLVSPSQDAIGEFTITTSNYAADLGNSSGGMPSMVIKNGTKQFHASAWEYNRNDALDAYNYEAKNTSGPVSKKAELRYNAFGFNAGGPVQFKSGKPKTFFFYNQEWRREISGLSPINSKAFNAAELGGNMEGLNAVAGNKAGTQLIWVPQTLDPSAIAKFATVGLHPADPFPNNTVPSSLINANAAAYIKAGYLLTPNQSDGLHYFSSATTGDFYREEIARVDHTFSDKLSVYGHMIYDSLSESAPIVSWTGNPFPTIGSLETVPSWTAVVHATMNLRPDLVNEIAYNENGNDITIGNTGLWKAPAGWTPKPLFSGANTNGKIPSVNIESGGGPFGENMASGNWPWQNWWRSNQIKDDLSYVKGSHNMKMGFAWLWTSKKQQIFVDTAGNYDFNGNATKSSSGQGGIGLADFLLGDAANFNQPQLQDAVNIHFNTIDAFFVDDWRLNKRLTLNLGLRWEALPHAYDANGRASNFYPYLYNANNAATFAGTNTNVLCTSTTQNAACANANLKGFAKVNNIALSDVLFYLNGIGLSGRNGVPKSLTVDHNANFAPRVGFALDVFGNQQTVLRGGGGIFFERNAGNEDYNLGTDLPFSNSSSTNFVYLDNPAVSYSTGANAGTAPTTTQGFTAIDPNEKITTVYQYSLGIQQQLRSNMVFTIGYVGNNSVHLSDTPAINTLRLNDITNRIQVCGTPCGGQSGIQADPFRPYLGWGGIAMLQDEAGAHYHSLQATVRASAWHNLSFGLAYTYSHAWDQQDGQIQFGGGNVTNPFNPKYDYGTAGFDQRQIARANFDYNLPIFQHSSGVARTVLGGWTVSGIVAMQSGTPLGIGAPDWNGFGGGTGNRANQIGPISYPKTKTKWFDPGAFSQPSPMTFGNAGKNPVTGPGRDNWNLSLYKDFKITERAGFQFKAESFNSFNHTQFNAVDTGVISGSVGGGNNATAGNLTGTTDPRVFQLGAKAYF